MFSQNSSLRHPTAGRASLALLAAMMFNAEAYDKPSAPAVAAPTSYAVKAKSYGTHPETDPPRYVRNLAATSIAAFDAKSQFGKKTGIKAWSAIASSIVSASSSARRVRSIVVAARSISASKAGLE